MILERYFPSQSEEIIDLFKEFNDINIDFNFTQNNYMLLIDRDSSNIRFTEVFRDLIEFIDQSKFDFQNILFISND